MAIRPSKAAKGSESPGLSYKKYEGFFSTVKYSIKYGAIVLCARYAYLATLALAGKSTFADIGFRVLGNLTISHGICYLVASGGVLYGVGQRRLRRRHIKRVEILKNNYERILNPGRTSSGLTEDGTTRPEDEL